MAEEEFPPFGGPPVGLETLPGKHQQHQSMTQPPAPGDRSLAEQMNNLMGRVRDLERRFSDTQDLLRFHEEESRKNFNRVWMRLKEFEDRVVAMSHKFADVEQQTHLIVNEIRLTAKKEDYDVLKRYIEYIKPVKFVTVDQVEKLVNDILEEHGHVKEKFVEEE